MKLAKWLKYKNNVPTILKRSLCIVCCITTSCVPVQVESPIETEKTLAFEMLELESQFSNVPPESFDLLRLVLNEGIAALGEDAVQPKTPEEAISASKVVSRVLAKHNFLQPTNFSNNPDTLGQALTPAELSDQDLIAVLSFEANTMRAQDYVTGRPTYLVDCDIGSLIIMSVFERLGWDTRLVIAPYHMFLRWHLPDGTTVNWDWANWGSYEDSVYFLARKITAKEQQYRGTYIRSLPRQEARGNFIGLMVIPPEIRGLNK